MRRSQMILAGAVLSLFALLGTCASHAQEMRLYTPDQSAVVGDTVRVFLYVTSPEWADSLSGVHAGVLDYDHDALSFVDVASYYPTANWNGPLGLVNSSCGTNDPYIHMNGHNGFVIGGECQVVIGGCATDCFWDQWNPWNVGGETIAARARFVVQEVGQTVVQLCPSNTFQYLTWIEWHYCNSNWEPDIVGNNQANDPATTITQDSVTFSVTSGGGGGGGGGELEKASDSMTSVKRKYKRR